MRIALAQINSTVGNLEGNIQKIKALIDSEKIKFIQLHRPIY